MCQNLFYYRYIVSELVKFRTEDMSNTSDARLHITMLLLKPDTGMQHKISILDI